MGVYLDSFPGALEPRQTPFDDAGEPAQPCVFIYMTNRYEGRWSHLMPLGFERLHDPQQYISMGYTQLWIMQKLTAVHPRAGARRKKRGAAPAAPGFEDGVVRDDFLALFHVLREPSADDRDHNDHLGGRRKYADALSYAASYADHRRQRTLVAKLLHDWQWH